MLELKKITIMLQCPRVLNELEEKSGEGNN